MTSEKSLCVMTSCKAHFPTVTRADKPTDAANKGGYMKVEVPAASDANGKVLRWTELGKTGKSNDFSWWKDFMYVDRLKMKLLNSNFHSERRKTL